MFSDLRCILCKELDSLDSIEHLLNCYVVKQQSGLDPLLLESVKYPGVFQVLRKQIIFVHVWAKIEQVRGSYMDAEDGI